MFQLAVLGAIAVLTAADQLTKAAIVATVKVNGPFSFLFGLLRFRYVENTGVAFSLFDSHPGILTAITAMLVAACIVFLLLHKVKHIVPNICLVCIAAGGLGNVIDRLARGFVVDFIEPMFVDFAVFNFADCCITVGAAALLIYEIYDTVVHSRKAKEANNG